MPVSATYNKGGALLSAHQMRRLRRRGADVRPHPLHQAPRVDDPQRSMPPLAHVPAPRLGAIPTRPHLPQDRLDTRPVRRERCPPTHGAAQHALDGMHGEPAVRAHDRSALELAVGRGTGREQRATRRFERAGKTCVERWRLDRSCWFGGGEHADGEEREERACVA